jgi:hypothetical protein
MHSRKWLAALACGMVVAGVTQQRWKHEVVLSNVDEALGFSWANVVSAQGVPAYTIWKDGRTWTDVYEGSTCLNRTVFGDGSAGAVGGFNSIGQLAWSAQEATKIHVMVGQRDFYSEVFGSESPNDHVYSCYSPDNQGLPLWIRTDKANAWNGKVLHGTEELSAGLSLYDPRGWAINGSGDCLWSGWTTENGEYEYDLYRNKTNYSRSILGTDRWTARATMNSRGDVLWAGSGTQTNASVELFLNGTNLTQGKYAGHNGALPEQVTNSGHILWQLEWPTVHHLMLDDRDISTAAFGSRPYDIFEQSAFMNEDGHVMWLGRTNDDNDTRVMLDERDLTVDAIGDDSGAWNPPRVIGIDRFGNAVWSGGGVKTDGKYEVFVNTFDLSRDALSPGEYTGAYAIASGVNGQVLWVSEDPSGLYTMRLSTPVPEPSALLLGIPLLVGLSRRRR